MALNGSLFINDPFNTSYQPWINLFESITGNGYLFFLFPVIVLTLALLYKTKKPEAASLFMIASGSLLSGGGIFVGSPDMVIAFTVFTAFGFVSLFASIIFMKR